MSKTYLLANVIRQTTLSVNSETGSEYVYLIYNPKSLAQRFYHCKYKILNHYSYENLRKIQYIDIKFTAVLDEYIRLDKEPTNVSH